MTGNTKQEISVIRKPTNRYLSFQRMFKSNMARSAAILGLLAAPFMNSNASLGQGGFHHVVDKIGEVGQAAVNSAPSVFEGAMQNALNSASQAAVNSAPSVFEGAMQNALNSASQAVVNSAPSVFEGAMQNALNSASQAVVNSASDVADDVGKAAIDSFPAIFKDMGECIFDKGKSIVSSAMEHTGGRIALGVAGTGLALYVGKKIYNAYYSDFNKLKTNIIHVKRCIRECEALSGEFKDIDNYFFSLSSDEDDIILNEAKLIEKQNAIHKILDKVKDSKEFFLEDFAKINTDVVLSLSEKYDGFSTLSKDYANGYLKGKHPILSKDGISEVFENINAVLNDTWHMLGILSIKKIRDVDQNVFLGQDKLSQEQSKQRMETFKNINSTVGPIISQNFKIVQKKLDALSSAMKDFKKVNKELRDGISGK